MTWRRLQGSGTLRVFRPALPQYNPLESNPSTSYWIRTCIGHERWQDRLSGPPSWMSSRAKGWNQVKELFIVYLTSPQWINTVPGDEKGLASQLIPTAFVTQTGTRKVDYNTGNYVPREVDGLTSFQPLTGQAFITERLDANKVKYHILFSKLKLTKNDKSGPKGQQKPSKVIPIS